MGGRSKGGGGVPGNPPWRDPGVLATDNNEFASAVSAAQENEPHPQPVRTDSSGARLAISPSMKVVEESPVPIQSNGRIVQSHPGRSVATFNEGASETYRG